MSKEPQSPPSTPPSPGVDAVVDSEARFQLLVDSVKDFAIFMLDPNGIVASWNAGAEANKGYRAEEIIGRHFSVFYPPEAVSSGWPRRELEAAREVGRFEDEGWRVRKDGTTFWANVVITAIYDAEKRLRGFAKVTRDMSERRHIERLEADRDRTNEFLAMLAHELRNPLAPIRNAANILALDPSPKTASWAAGVLGRQAAQLTRLVDDLLDSARIVSGRIEISRQATPLGAVISRATEAIHPLTEERGQRLEVELPEHPVILFADLARLSQAVLNLLSNASKYTPAGGGIRVRVERHGDIAILRVEDDGAGIAPAMLPRVFDLFAQGERALDRGQGGLGIGLALVKRITELHGGQVEIASPGLGRGTVATLRLPIVEPTLVTDPRASAANGVTWVRRRVLVIDDNRDSAESMSMLLRAWGHEAFVALEGEEGLALARTHRPEFVLLDIGLPGMDGYEVARRLRALELEPTPVLAAMTGYGRAEDRRESKAAGFDHHLVKPVDPDALAVLIRGETKPDVR
jgi:PAS domain S-box-containing protein